MLLSINETVERNLAYHCDSSNKCASLLFGEASAPKLDAKAYVSSFPADDLQDYRTWLRKIKQKERKKKNKNFQK